MKIISWNVRGAGCGGFKSQLRDLLKVHNLGITALIEIELIQIGFNKQFKI